MTLRETLTFQEGIRLKPYKDTQGKLTIGVGRNLDDIGILQIEAMMMLTNDITRVSQEVTNAFSWIKSLNANRQDIVFNMVFNLGLEKFKEFKNLIQALRIQNYELAAKEMLNSQWAVQVGVRAFNLADAMRRG